MENINCRKSKLFKRFMFSYIAILLVPLLLLSILIYNNLIGSLSSEIKNATLTALSQALDVLDIRLKELNYIAVQLPQNPNIMPTLYSGNVSNLLPYQYYELVKELKNYRATNAFIDNIAVCFRNSDVIVNADGKYSMTMFFNNVYRYKGTSGLDMSYTINTLQDLVIRSAEPVYIGNAVQSIITYLQPIPVNDTFYRATLMITMDADSINKLITNSLGNYKGDVYILDYNGKIITSVLSGNGLSLNMDITSFLKGKSSGMYIRNINGQNMMVFYAKSSATNWSAVAIVPSVQVLSRVNRMLFLSLLVILMIVSIGVILAYYFSYNNYRPIKKLADMVYGIPVSDHRVNETYRDELNMISDMLAATISRDKALQERLDQQKPIIKADFLMRLFRGELSGNAAIREMADFLGLDLRKGPFAVIIFNIDDYDDFVENNPEPMQDVLRLAVINTAEQLYREIGQGYTSVAADDKIAMLIDFEGNSINYRQAMVDLAEKVRLFIVQHFGFTLTIGISSVYPMLMDVSKSYMEARMAIDYKMIKGKDTVIMFDQISVSNDERYYYSIQYENQILDCLKLGDFDGIYKVLADIIENINKKPISIAMARCIYFDIINTAMKALAELKSEYYNDIVKDGHSLPVLLRCETITEVYDQVVGFYRNVCEHIKNTRNNKVSNFEKNILQYLNEHYCDKDLSLTFLADKFAVTPSYLSRFFKNRIGYNFVDYLHTLRLKKAKQLLLYSDYSIAEIADKVGYTDSHSFIRSFKKYENITPGQFKELCKLDSSKI